VDAVAELLSGLVAIDSVNPDLVPGGAGEANIAAFAAAWLERAGLEVSVEEAAPGRPNVIARAVGLGGYVASSTTQPDSHGRIVSGAVTLKIPAASIAAFLNGMPSTFTASSINFSAIDHTAQFVDVNARLASAHAHLAALNTLLAKATSIGDISNLEQEIEAVQTEVDTDQGQLNVLTASVELATASIQLTERGISLVVVPPPNPVAGGVSGGWKNAVQVTGAALEGVVSALPLLVLAVIGLLVWRRQSRGPIARRTPGASE